MIRVAACLLFSSSHVSLARNFRSHDLRTTRRVNFGVQFAGAIDERVDPTSILIQGNVQLKIRMRLNYFSTVGVKHKLMTLPCGGWAVAFQVLSIPRLRENSGRKGRHSKDHRSEHN